MKLIKPIEARGSFWLSRDQDAKIAGVLKISEEGWVTVELAGLFAGDALTQRRTKPGVPQDLNDWDEHRPRMVGIVDPDGFVTLDGCIQQSSNNQLGTGISSSVIVAEAAYIGAGYSDDEEVAFTEFSFSIEGLDVWLDTTGMQTGHGDDWKSLWIRYQVLDPIPVVLSGDQEVSFRFGWETLGFESRPMVESQIKQTALITLKTQEERPLEHFTSFAFQMAHLLSLALDEDICIQSMTGHLDDKTPGSRNIPCRVSVYGQFGPWASAQPTIRWHDALFLYPVVADRINDLMNYWFDNYDRFMPAIELYFAARTIEPGYLHMHVLWLAQALEALHRQSSTETAMSAGELNDLLESIESKISKHEWRSIEPRLRHINELSFRVRIRRLVEPFGRLFGDRAGQRKFINRVSDTRNYLTHYDPSTTRNRAVELQELLDTRDKMAALFQLHLLQLIGFNESEITGIVVENSRLIRKLGLSPDVLRKLREPKISSQLTKPAEDSHTTDP